MKPALVLTLDRLIDDLSHLPLRGEVVGVHSSLKALGKIAPSPLTWTEKKKGMRAYGKTLINAFLEVLGPQGTLFVPAHSLNGLNDLSGKGYYNPRTSPSTVGTFTQSLIAHPDSIRSRHPTHSIAALGPEAPYLTRGHDAFAQPVGIQNALAKTAGLDGIILFIGETLKANTTFHAYETLLLPALASFFPGVAAAEIGRMKMLVAQTWCPHLHRDFYGEAKRRTRAFSKMRRAGLLHEAKLGPATLYYYFAKKTARFFAEEVFPMEPDILHCKRRRHCSANHDCENIRGIMRRLYAGAGGRWDARKIRSGMDKTFLRLLRPGVQRL